MMIVIIIIMIKKNNNNINSNTDNNSNKRYEKKKIPDQYKTQRCDLDKWIAIELIPNTMEGIFMDDSQ